MFSFFTRQRLRARPVGDEASKGWRSGRRLARRPRRRRQSRAPQEGSACEGGGIVHFFACPKKRTKEKAPEGIPLDPTDGTSAAGSCNARPKPFGNPFRTRRLTPSQTRGKGCFAPQNPLTCPRKVYTIAALAYFYLLHPKSSPNGGRGTASAVDGGRLFPVLGGPEVDSRLSNW